MAIRHGCEETPSERYGFLCQAQRGQLEESAFGSDACLIGDSPTHGKGSSIIVESLREGSQEGESVEVACPAERSQFDQCLQVLLRSDACLGQFGKTQPDFAESHAEFGSLKLCELGFCGALLGLAQRVIE